MISELWCRTPGCHFLLGQTKLPNFEPMWVMGYDTSRKTYRYVLFGSNGRIEENVGQRQRDLQDPEHGLLFGMHMAIRRPAGLLVEDRVDDPEHTGGIGVHLIKSFDLFGRFRFNFLGKFGLF